MDNTKSEGKSTPMDATPAQQFVTQFQTHPPEGVTFEIGVSYDQVGRKVSNCVDIIWIKRTGEKGAGARALTSFCTTADELDITLELSIQPKNKTALVPYYRKFGFRKMASKDDYYAMRRPPQRMGRKAPV